MHTHRARSLPREPLHQQAAPTLARLPGIILLLVAAATAAAGCAGGSSEESIVGASARIVELPGAADEIEFDDITYSARLGRVLVPARESGLYLVTPKSAKVERVEHSADVDSADEGRGQLYLLDRDERQISVIETGGTLLSTASTSASPDYVRYVPRGDRGELWVSQPDGIDVFTLGEQASVAPRQAMHIAVPGGAEGLTISTDQGAAYTHAGNDLVAVDIKRHEIRSRWPTGCDGTHGFPRIDERKELVLTSCVKNGEVSLLDLNERGRQVQRYEVGGGESLPAHSQRTGNFFARSDPGTTIATLAPTTNGMELVREVNVPPSGHCLIADDLGYYWTCDEKNGRILRFDDL